MPIVGCGNGSQSTNPSKGTSPSEQATTVTASNPYLKALLGFRDAVAAKATTYDAYGYAEYMPPAQRAAIDAFCILVNREPESLETGKLADPRDFASKLTAIAIAEADEDFSAAPLRRSIDKLRSILGQEPFDRDLARRYARTCYR